MDGEITVQENVVGSNLLAEKLKMNSTKEKLNKAYTYTH